MTSYLASIKVGDGSTITTEWFNAADAHKLIRPSCYSGRTFADDVCSKRILWSWHWWEEKKCENLKEVIDTKYSDFDEPVFQNMKWFDPQT